MSKVTEYFDLKVMECRCGCGYVKIKGGTLEKVEQARRDFGKPFHISSWCRCEKHNKKCGGSVTSSHLEGYAIDIKFTIVQEMFTALFYLITAGFTRIGIGGNFIHVDDDPGKPQNVIWFY